MALLGSAIPAAQLPWLVCGALGGYLLLMFTNPVRASLRDGFRCIRRYSTLWITLGIFGFAGALFQLALRCYYASVLPFEERPVFVWMREAWRDSDLWLHGSSQSLWHLPPHALGDAIRESALPALESVAGLFNCAFSTFPVAALAALLLLVNWQGHHGVMHRALRQRFGRFGWIVYAGVLVCALGALAKPCLYAAPQLIIALGGSPVAQLTWFQWAPVVAWAGFLFEYLFGVCMQIYLILLAYAWVRGLTFTHSHLLDFAIRRCTFVLKWALVVMLLSSVFIDLPLILKNFAAFQAWFPDDAAVIDGRQRLARTLLTGILLLSASVQITLVFHSESLGAAFRDHRTFLRDHWRPFAWFVIVAALHCFALHALQRIMAVGLGEGTAPWVLWTLLFPWIAGLVLGWLLASWVCVYKRYATPAQSAATQTMFRF